MLILLFKTIDWADFFDIYLNMNPTEVSLGYIAMGGLCQPALFEYVKHFDLEEFAEFMEGTFEIYSTVGEN